MNEEVSYKLFYKLDGVKVWKHFYFDAFTGDINDKFAKEHAENWAKRNNCTNYGLEKITKERLI